MNWKEGELVRVTEERMVCNDCANSTGEDAVCKKYELKPLKVLDGGECEYYERKNE